jgi:hypothetical protein
MRSINIGVSTLNRRGFYLFRFFRSLIIYSSAERRRDNEVISMSLTVNSKPSLLLLILVLFFFSLLLPTDEYMNRNEQSSRKRTDSKYRRTSSTGYPGNRKGITRCSQCLIVIIWGGALVPL